MVYLLVMAELATCFDPAGSSSGLYVNQVMMTLQGQNMSAIQQ